MGEQIKGPELLDGTSTSVIEKIGEPESKEDHPSIENYDLEPVGGVPEVKDDKDDKDDKNDKGDDELPPDPEEGGDEELPGEEPESDEKPEDDSKPTDVGFYSMEVTTEYKEVQVDQKSLTRQIQRVSAVKGAEPQKPKDIDDEDAMGRYERRMDDWQIRMDNAKFEIEQLQEDLRTSARKAQDVFLAENTEISDEDKKGFYDFVSKREAFYLDFLSGESTLNELYVWYKIKSGQKIKKDQDKITKFKKEKVRITPVKVKGSTAGEGLSRGNNGLPKQYKYANMPMFKGYVKDLIKQKYSITGERLTAKFINELCQQEYKVIKGS